MFIRKARFRHNYLVAALAEFQVPIERVKVLKPHISDQKK